MQTSLKLNKPRVGYCRAIARKAFALCSAAFPHGWPSDVRLAAELALPGFVVVELESLPSGVSAIIDIEDRSIGVNAAHSTRRKRFAVAHEVGHVWLEHPSYVFEVSGKQDRILEEEADAFAAEFLVPMRTLRKQFRSCRDWEALAKTFDVDREVMYYRFRDAKLWREVT
ncbi:MAG: ImmA/IrrE family metallo-endopeptidase [Chitinivibrionales bacterium]|nr:ImmA/IrrE family metallo-endopeptidase [Chitinivibrionales bacterium]